MKAKMIHNCIPFSKSLTNFSLSYWDTRKGSHLFNTLYSQGFSYVFKTYHPIEHKTTMEDLICMYHAYLCLLVEKKISIKKSYLNTSGEWIYETMSYASLHSKGEEIFERGGRFFEKDEMRQGLFCEIYVEDVDFKKLLKQRAQDILEEKPTSVYMQSKDHQNLQKITQYLKNNYLPFYTREEFYKHVLQNILPDEFKPYSDAERHSLLRSTKFKSYWEFFKPEECGPEEETEKDI